MIAIISLLDYCKQPIGREMAGQYHQPSVKKDGQVGYQGLFEFAPSYLKNIREQRKLEEEEKKKATTEQNE